jgi:hypothetical protein
MPKFSVLAKYLGNILKSTARMQTVVIRYSQQRHELMLSRIILSSRNVSHLLVFWPDEASLVTMFVLEKIMLLFLDRIIL